TGCGSGMCTPGIRSSGRGLTPSRAVRQRSCAIFSASVSSASQATSGWTRRFPGWRYLET
ncbi:uncharacterized protein METZ01_LOCUS247334, partial [marine metagenome]